MYIFNMSIVGRSAINADILFCRLGWFVWKGHVVTASSKLTSWQSIYCCGTANPHQLHQICGVRSFLLAFLMFQILLLISLTQRAMYSVYKHIIYYSLLDIQLDYHKTVQSEGLLWAWTLPTLTTLSRIFFLFFRVNATTRCKILKKDYSWMLFCSLFL